MGYHIHVLREAKIFDKYCLIIIQWQRGMTKKRKQLEKRQIGRGRLQKKPKKREKTLWSPPKRNLNNAVNCFSFSQVVGPRRWSGHKVEGHLDHHHSQ